MGTWASQSALLKAGFPVLYYEFDWKKESYLPVYMEESIIDGDRVFFIMLAEGEHELPEGTTLLVEEHGKVYRSYAPYMKI